MREFQIDLENEEELQTFDGMAEWKKPPEEVLKIIDGQLEKFGLEIVRDNGGYGSDIMWKIEPRQNCREN